MTGAVASSALVFGVAAFGSPANAATTAAAEQKALVDRGVYLMTAVVACGNCHADRDANLNVIPGRDLAGRERRRPNGTYSSNPNITSDMETGIGRYSEQDIMNVVRYGRRPDGTLIHRRMPVPVFRSISDYDLRAIAHYVKSTPPVHHLVHRPNVDPPPPPEGYGPKISVPDVPRTDKVAYGKYLAYSAHCVTCHTPEKAPGIHDYEHHLGAGGWVAQTSLEGKPLVLSKNITPDVDYGIGAWTDKQIITAIRTGVAPGGVKLRYPMGSPYYQYMKDEDVLAIVAYLHTLKPIASFGLGR
jgi:mono/diheme cytochrome c family protein